LRHRLPHALTLRRRVHGSLRPLFCKLLLTQLLHLLSRTAIAMARLPSQLCHLFFARLLSGNISCRTGILRLPLLCSCRSLVIQL